MAFFNHLKQFYKAYLFIGYAFLLVMHFIIKDHYFPLSIVFYATPIPVLIGLGLFVLIIHHNMKLLRTCILVCVLLLGFHWAQHYYFLTKPDIQYNDHSKILYWNLAKRDRLSVDYISKKVLIHQPEILAFVEAPHTTLKNLNDLKTVLPEYNFKKLRGAMLVATKGDITYLKHKFSDDNYKINLIEINTKTKDYRLIITDLTANIFVNKKIPLDFLLHFSETNKVDIIIGDFNTPFESVHFESYRTNYFSMHHFNNGFTATWPIGLPLLEIDHIWISKDYQPIKLHKDYSEYSDHALLISEFK